jgi:uncharacterized membrane protein YphA (DoxX/SURF4 family)
VLLGLVLLFSGTGKVPGQTEFIDNLLRTFWTPAFAYFIGHVLPWVEVLMGAALVLGVLPRLVAALCLPLTLGFMFNNGWAIMQGMEYFPQCSYCFGFWEDMTRVLSPMESLIIDIALFVLALLVVVLHREGFFKFRPWFMKRGGK